MGFEGKPAKIKNGADDRCKGISRKFSVTIRLALNAHDIRDNHTAYGALIGHVFGQRAHRKARFGKPRISHRESPVSKSSLTKLAKQRS